MTLQHSSSGSDSVRSVSEDLPGVLRDALEAARRWLPQQGPLGVFVHHNTLHHLEDMPFHEAVVDAGERLGAEPYATEALYREAFRQGRIDDDDLQHALDSQLDSIRSRKRRLFSGGLSIEELRALALRHDLDPPDPLAAEFVLEEGGLSMELATACRRRMAELSSGVPLPRRPRQLRRHRDIAHERFGVDPDHDVHEVLIPICAAYCDRGIAESRGAFREEAETSGFYAVVREMWIQHPPARFGSRLRQELAEQRDRGLDAGGAAIQALAALGVPEKEWTAFVSATLQRLPGWAGMIDGLDRREHAAPGSDASSALLDFLAIRLTLDVLSLAAYRASTEGRLPTAEKLWQLALTEREAPHVAPSRTARAVQLGRLAQLRAWPPAFVEALPESDLRTLFTALDHFGPAVRRRVWHEAYERHFRREILLAIRARRKAPDDTPVDPTAQVVLCIDEREESLRRHLEEVDANLETVGTAGFFGVAIDYRGIDDGHYVPLCPVVVNPQHAIEERAHEEDVHLLGRRHRVRGAWLRTLHRLTQSSHSFGTGPVVTPILGWLAAVPLVLAVLAPRLSQRVARWASRDWVPSPRTRLSRTAEGRQNEHGKPLGFRVEEQIERVAAVLRGTGMVRHLAPLVVLLGHGSTSLNNPHESAHDCGACGGRQGGANARLFAEMANDPEVRAGLAAQGLRIPDEVWFVGGLHDTCSDSVVLYDTDRVPVTHRARLDTVARAIDEARARDAHERCRRFDFAPDGLSFQQALRHAERRATALDEPRPEYGHATNAICVVGRRRLTRRLFLDRRAFLTSYDPTIDPDASILAGTLGAVVPVCGGINLEYYFSFVDNERYGCGTKLPHNITGMVGVMNGPRSDLRTGLPWQMVEIHEPVRLLFVIEATPAAILEVARANPAIAHAFFNAWVQVASVHPTTGAIHELQGDRWVRVSGPPVRLLEAASSSDWYQGRHSTVGPALVGLRTRGLSSAAAASTTGRGSPASLASTESTGGLTDVA